MSFSKPITIQVALAIPFADFLSYKLPEHITTQQIQIGLRVIVPFRNKKLMAIVISINSDDSTNKLREIDSILDNSPLISEESLLFFRQIHNYYLNPLGEVIFAGIPKWFKNINNPKLPKEIWWQLNDDIDFEESILNIKSEKQKSIFQYLKENGPLQSKSMTHVVDNASAQCQALFKKKYLIQSELCFVDHKAPGNPNFKLTPDQQIAINELNKTKQFQSYLLDGITGSGKTEIYIRQVKDIIAKNQQALILVPEIGLTPQLFHEFAKRIHGRVAVFHSGLTPATRARTWIKTKTGDIDVIVATRSGIFIPFNDLALIIVDEEHDLSFKQQDGFRYSARDLAVMRGKIENIPVILGSATPSMESFQNAQIGKYIWLKLRQRTNNQELPKISILDIKRHKMNKGLSKQVIEMIRTEYENGNQALVFLNRRGWSPKFTCQECAWVAECDECDTYLTYHKHRDKLICHHCDRSYSISEFCPECGSQKVKTMGVGTEKIHQGLSLNIPEANIIRVDRDTVKTANQWNKTITEIKTGKPCIMIGTQMLSKGHDFPNLTLVVIVNVDNSFYSLDFRAIEHLSQLIIQVSGRAGRKHKSGQVIIQTQNPENPFFDLLLNKSYQEFAQNEIAQRKAVGFPPGSFMAIIRARSTNEAQLNQFFESVLEMTVVDETVSVMGPLPAPMYKKMGFYQMQLIFNGNNRKSLHFSLKNLILTLRKNKITNNIIWSLDMDPINLN
jgi:primosomal protein N' (replication factor Y)